MCWPKKVSDRSYNSYTKFGQMMGYYTHKTIFSKVLCKSCRICSVAELLGEKARIYNCINNYNDSSKQMESHVILIMVTECV